MRLPEPDAGPEGEGIALAELTPPLLDAALRLMRLLDTPADIAVVAPLIEKELLYRLMTSGQGTRLRHMAIAGSQTHRIARAIEWIRDHFAEPMRVESLAQAVNMSVSSLHHHFKHVTTLARCSTRSSYGCTRRDGCCCGRAATSGRWPPSSATKARRSSAANTAGCSARRRCATSCSCAGRNCSADGRLLKAGAPSIAAPVTWRPPSSAGRPARSASPARNARATRRAYRPR